MKSRLDKAENGVDDIILYNTTGWSFILISIFVIFYMKFLTFLSRPMGLKISNKI